MTTPESSISLVKDGSIWRFADDSEADLTKAQERLRALATLEATDYDLMAPLTREMGNVEVALGQDNDEEEQPTIRFEFFAPLEEGGKAMVQVTGRETVMGVEVAKVDAILGNLEELRPKTEDKSAPDSE